MAFIAVLAVSLMVFFAPPAETARKGCPADPVSNASSPEPLNDVCIPEGYTPIPMDYFDDFSWRAFVAAVWPAAKGHRGIAERSLKPGAPGPTVFETYKSLQELFHTDGSAPTAFNEYDPSEQNACHVAAAFGDLVLASKSAIEDVGQVGAGELTGPLAAQNGRYVRYQTLYNQTAYDFIVSNRFYLRDHLPPVPRPRPDLPVMQFPNGSAALKAAWLNLDGFSAEQKARFYTRMAVVKDPVTGACEKVSMGLVGLHLAIKTPSRPQWIWSSFEQADLVPPRQFGGTGQFIFHDGNKQNPMPAENPLPLAPLAPEPVKPFNIERSVMAPIHPKTGLMNMVYQRLLAKTPWENYQLVTTQWPRLEGDQSAPVPATQGGDINTTFPGAGAFSAFANLSMETFEQSRPQLGCMSCHNKARLTADFLWSVLDHAYPPKIGPAHSATAH